MSIRWALAVTNQLAGSVVQLGARELLDRSRGTLENSDAACQMRSDDVREPSFTESAKTATFVVAAAALAIWAFSWLGSMCWWLATGRGPGGRFLAASSVTLRHYDLRKTQ